MRASVTSFVSLALVLFTAACAPTTQGPVVSSEAAQAEAVIQREAAVREMVDEQARAQRVAQPILVSNAQLCGTDVGLYTGAAYLASSQAQREFRQTYADIYGIVEQPTVLQVLPNSPASGKLKTGDIVKTVNGKKISKGASGVMALRNLSKKNEDKHAFEYVVERGGKDVSVSVMPEYACNYDVMVAPDERINAFDDGKSIVVTRGMMRFASSDNELALVLGHELAHNSRAHARAKTGNAVIGSLLGAVVTVATGVDVTSLGRDIGAGAYSQRFESEADYVGLYHTARAGYPIADAPQFWRRMASSNPEAIHLSGSSHPSTAVRFVALDQTVKEIQSKKTAGRTLAPEEKPKEVASAEKKPARTIKKSS